jgi:hypothetical protein
VVALVSGFNEQVFNSILIEKVQDLIGGIERFLNFLVVGFV